jgi:hypothetical protein
MIKQPTFFDAERMGFAEALELTAESLRIQLILADILT